jgi:hypothetical protein
MPEIDWQAVEDLLQPHYEADTLNDWASARRVCRSTSHIAQGLRPFDADRARLLALFHGLTGIAAHPHQRRKWARPLLNAGVPLQTQMWLWIALARFREAPEANEECAVRDAWRLQSVGAIGVARAMLIAGREDRSVSSGIEAAKQAVERAVFLTPAGRRLGVRRIVTARRFLKELEEE